MDINITTGSKNETEFTIECINAGYGACIPVIDGVRHPELCFSYTSEADKQSAVSFLEKALKASHGDACGAMNLMYNAAMNIAEGIIPDEQVTVEDEEFMLCLKAKKAYTLDRNEVANLDDIPAELPAEAVKLLLVERIKNYLKELEIERLAEEAYADEEDEWDYEGKDEWDYEDEDEDAEESEELEDDETALDGEVEITKRGGMLPALAVQMDSRNNL